MAYERNAFAAKVQVTPGTGINYRFLITYSGATVTTQRSRRIHSDVTHNQRHTGRHEYLAVCPGWQRHRFGRLVGI
jgi:hypothetical protein